MYLRILFVVCLYHTIIAPLWDDLLLFSDDILDVSVLGVRLYLTPAIHMYTCSFLPPLVDLDKSETNQGHIRAGSLACYDVTLVYSTPIIEARIKEGSGKSYQNPTLRLRHVFAKLAPREHWRVKLILCMLLLISTPLFTCSRILFALPQILIILVCHSINLTK